MKNINKILTTLSLAASDTREDTIKSIIRTTLLESENPISLNELNENIDIIYDIKLYDIEFYSVIDLLIRDNEIVSYGKDQFILSKEEKRKLVELDAKLKSSEILRFLNFRAFIYDKYKEKIEDDDIKFLWNTLKDYLCGCFYQYGEKAIEFLHPMYIKQETTYYNQSEVYSDAIKTLKKPELIAAFKVSVDSFPDYATKEDLDFIDDLGQKTLSFASLGLSPEQANDDLDKELINWTLYLDTNFLFSILDLHANTENESCKELLKLVILNKDIINIKFRYSELTLRELRYKKIDFNNLDETLTQSAIKAILKSEELDEFARKFYVELLNNPEDTIHPSRIIDLAEITLPKQGIEISRNQKQVEALGESFIDAKIAEYQRYINEQNDYREEYARKNHLPYRPYFRADIQMKHDVVLREIILGSRKLFRKEEVQTFNDVQYYGLTLDELLIKFDTYENKKSIITKYPTFFRPSFLLNKLIKLLPIKTQDYKKAFLKAVSARGFYKDGQKSNEIIKIASHLKRMGIDNEDVLLNLISEKLFLEKFHQENTKDDFNSIRFFESELNTILTEKIKDASESKLKADQLVVKTTQDELEKEKLRKTNEEKDERLNLFQQALDKLHKNVKILEDRQSINTHVPTFNFEAGEKQKEVERLQNELLEHKKKNTILENEKRLPLRNNFFRGRIILWRLKTFGYLLIGTTIFIITPIYISYLGAWNSKNISTMVDTYRNNIIISSLIWLSSAIFTGFFIKRFSDQFGESNVNAYKLKLSTQIPENLREIK